MAGTVALGMSGCDQTPEDFKQEDERVDFCEEVIDEAEFLYWVWTTNLGYPDECALPVEDVSGFVKANCFSEAKKWNESTKAFVGELLINDCSQEVQDRVGDILLGGSTFIGFETFDYGPGIYDLEYSDHYRNSIAEQLYRSDDESTE